MACNVSDLPSREHPEQVFGAAACMVQERGAGIQSEPGIGGSQPLSMGCCGRVQRYKLFVE